MYAPRLNRAALLLGKVKAQKAHRNVLSCRFVSEILSEL